MQQRIVGADTVRMLELGHPWVIADHFTKRWPKGTAGDLVQLVDERGKALATALLDPADRVVARVLSRKPVQLDRRWLLERFRHALILREQYLDLLDTDAYRLVNGEGDGLPGLTVDRYGDYLMVQLYCEGWRPHLKLLTAVLQELLNPNGIYEKARPQNTRELEAVSDSKCYGRLLAGTAAPRRLEVQENGLTFLVSMEEGLNTGLFLDQRENRRALLPRMAGKRFLNLFAYTGAFSVAAAAAGAAQVTSVDVSSGYTDWNRANFEANRLNIKKHRFLVGDCLAKLAELAAAREQFDVVLMDPPSFSTTGKGRFTTRGGTSDLVAASLPLLPEGGLLICSSNHQKTDLADYLKELRRGALQAGCDLRVIEQRGQPADFPFPATFPEGRYLKYVLCVKTE
ncbi:class I SAM-dependent rRNA methyltransferase [Trichlorobacter ammonificans]|uniref:LSU m5C1962 methyltransferase RlmI n=1 Tax=Trichlorobacter ammonificans TaxID=2916410 RepID=A0ABM9DE00_9BACT|nr:class I SAM-dependent rRNA methyltransferase [Trichlorobacter ammonificans]CAH2032695.1 LSU m5C1962 methyltransferase RlmI [Trichlorobacter ammonificans]